MAHMYVTAQGQTFFWRSDILMAEKGLASLVFFAHYITLDKYDISYTLFL